MRENAPPREQATKKKMMMKKEEEEEDAMGQRKNAQFDFEQVIFILRCC